MADYQLTTTDSVIRTADGACIPADLANRDYVEYLEWIEDGGVPDPYEPPPDVPPEPTTGQTIIYEHENRIRALEGQPPLTLVDFITKVDAQ
jgi:hypothetical protein